MIKIRPTFNCYDYVDIKLVAFATVALTIIIAKLLPKDMIDSVPYWLLGIIFVITMIRPVWKFYKSIKKED